MSDNAENNIPEEMVEAMKWSMESLERVKNKIDDYDLDRNEAVNEICQYLDDKYGKKAKQIEIGNEIARPLTKKMRYFNNKTDHTFVRSRLGLRKGIIEDQDAIPVTLNFKDAGINKIIIRMRAFPAKFSPIFPCEQHEQKFRTRVGDIIKSLVVRPFPFRRCSKLNMVAFWME